jgi:uncharacterized membrane protein YeaQ/YmgE (transglycosylase-associated protein family)
MIVVTWAFLGVIAGFLTSKVINRSGKHLYLDLLIGIVGALAVGTAVRIFSDDHSSSLDILSVRLASAGALISVLGHHSLQKLKRLRKPGNAA